MTHAACVDFAPDKGASAPAAFDARDTLSTTGWRPCQRRRTVARAGSTHPACTTSIIPRPSNFVTNGLSIFAPNLKLKNPILDFYFFATCSCMLLQRHQHRAACGAQPTADPAGRVCQALSRRRTGSSAAYAIRRLILASDLNCYADSVGLPRAT